MGKIYEIFGFEPHSMTYALMERAQIASHIPAGASVALKPNLVVAVPSGKRSHHPRWRPVRCH